MIPTAEELLEELYDKYNAKGYCKELILEAMKEFAKLHVKAAIKACIEEAPSGSSTDTVSYEDVCNALKNAYSDELIK